MLVSTIFSSSKLYEIGKKAIEPVSQIALIVYAREEKQNR